MSFGVPSYVEVGRIGWMIEFLLPQILIRSCHLLVAPRLRKEEGAKPAGLLHNTRNSSRYLHVSDSPAQYQYTWERKRGGGDLTVKRGRRRNNWNTWHICPIVGLFSIRQSSDPALLWLHKSKCLFLSPAARVRVLWLEKILITGHGDGSCCEVYV